MKSLMIPPTRLAIFVTAFGLSYILLIAALVYGISASFRLSSGG